MGDTDSLDFPVTEQAFQRVYGGGFMDGFVAKLNPVGSALVYSTYLGGSGFDESYGIVVDEFSNGYLTGGTNSLDFPITENAFQRAFAGGPEDAFVAKLNPTGSAFVYSSYLGGSLYDLPLDIALGAPGSVYVVGLTESPDFPRVSAFQGVFGGEADAFVAMIKPDVVPYTWLGFLPPLEPENKHLFKRGSTIPVKFRISDPEGNHVPDAFATLAVYYLVGGAPAGEAEVVSTAAGDWGDQFRYSPQDDLYIFNLSTKHPSYLGYFTYMIVVTLDDGQSQEVEFSLK